MDLPKYTGTIHPEEWLKQIQTCCYLKEITDEQKILRICKLKIDSSINIPDEIDTLDKLIKTLKSHSIFTIFKDTCKRKLQILKYIPKQEVAIFLAKFRSLCNDAEINNLEEIKNLLFNTYSSNEFFKNEVIKRIESVNSKHHLGDFNSISEIVKLFNDVVFDELNIIKYGSLIALKHVSTGRYLSSCSINYETGSKRQVVFTETLCNPHALWFLEKTQSYNQKRPYQQNIVFYDDKFYLKHKVTSKLLGMSKYHKSPTTGHSEASCCDNSFNNLDCQFINLKSRNNNKILYVKSKDVINLKNPNDKILRSHDFTFTINDEIFQEVIGHTDRIGANDEWCIELVENI